MTSPGLTLGPLVRHVDDTSASVWVETDAAASVVVHAADRSWSAQTFGVHGHHYALVEVTGLAPGAVAPYSVEIGGTTVWPEPGSTYPQPVIATMKPGKPLRMAFGSCRTSVTHDKEGNRIHGVDAMRAYALRMADAGSPPWPDLVLFLGDQVYADETSAEMRSFIESRRDVEQPPWDELNDYEEYAHLYRLAWSDPVNRWLLSTLPSAMIFDDHDIRDDWNTSASWRRKMESTSWWHDRVVAGLSSYWVYQHLGNLSPAGRGTDEVWQLVCSYDGPGELDLSATLDALANRVDQQPETYQWSFARDFGPTRLVVVDSRAARVLEPGNRSILNENEMDWLDEQMRGGFDHLLVGTSLPFLLSPGLHHLEAFSEALADGAWGRVGSRAGEWLRQTVDLEHWAAFQDGFRRVAGMAVEVASGQRGPAPRTVTFLSGDVHHSYVSEVVAGGAGAVGSGAGGSGAGRSRIVQAVCSPIRNPLPRYMRFVAAFLSYGMAGPMGRAVARSAKVPDPPFTWESVRGPWFDNNLATLEATPTTLRMWWDTGVVDGDDHEHPRLERVASVGIEPGRSRGGRQSPVQSALEQVRSRFRRGLKDVRRPRS